MVDGLLEALAATKAHTPADTIGTHTTGDTPLEVDSKALVDTLGHSLEDAAAGTLEDKLRNEEARHLSMPWLKHKQRKRPRHLLSHSTMCIQTKCRHAASHLMRGKSQEIRGKHKAMWRPTYWWRGSLRHRG